VLLVRLAACLSGPPPPPFGSVPIVAAHGACDAPRTDLAVGCAIDGDTLDLDRCGAGERVRLLGLDAPETAKADAPAECGAAEATDALATLVHGRRLALSFDARCTDVYGRTLGYVWLVGEDAAGIDARWLRTGWDAEPDVAAALVNEILLGTGAAAPYPAETGGELVHQERLDRAADEAMRDGLGWWGACQGVRR
jgi:endonuclease YncB( thermonuclease family)